MHKGGSASVTERRVRVIDPQEREPGRLAVTGPRTGLSLGRQSCATMSRHGPEQSRSIIVSEPNLPGSLLLHRAVTACSPRRRVRHGDTERLSAMARVIEKSQPE